MNKTQKNTVFNKIGSNGQFSVVNKSKDNAVHVNLSYNGHQLKELFYLLSTHLAMPCDSITF